jgi:hypothetical protein
MNGHSCGRVPDWARKTGLHGVLRLSRCGPADGVCLDLSLVHLQCSDCSLRHRDLPLVRHTAGFVEPFEVRVSRLAIVGGVARTDEVGKIMDNGIYIFHSGDLHKIYCPIILLPDIKAIHPSIGLEFIGGKVQNGVGVLCVLASPVGFPISQIPLRNGLVNIPHNPYGSLRCLVHQNGKVQMTFLVPALVLLWVLIMAVHRSEELLLLFVLHIGSRKSGFRWIIIEGRVVLK